MKPFCPYVQSEGQHRYHWTAISLANCVIPEIAQTVDDTVTAGGDYCTPLSPHSLL